MTRNAIPASTFRLFLTLLYIYTQLLWPCGTQAALSLAQPRLAFLRCPCVVERTLTADATRAARVFVVQNRSTHVNGLYLPTLHTREIDVVSRQMYASRVVLHISEMGFFALMFKHDGVSYGEQWQNEFQLLPVSRPSQCPSVLGTAFEAKGPVQDSAKWEKKMQSHFWRFVTLSLQVARREQERIPREKHSSHTRIVGGDLASSESQSHLVSLSFGLEGKACSGTLLSSRWVLTAAHCNVTTSWQARIGAARQAIGVPTLIKQVFNHELYVDDISGLDYDVAVVELLNDAPPGSTYVSVNDNSGLPQVGSFVRVIGYGQEAENVEGNSRLRQVDVPTTLWSTCRAVYSEIDVQVKDELHVCTGYEHGGCSFCHGDSGGPILQYDGDGQPVQMGIISFQLGCGEPRIPGVSTRTSAYVEWMAAKGAVFTRSSTSIAVFTADSPVTSAENLEGDLEREKRVETRVIIGWSLFAGVTVLITVVVAMRFRKFAAQRRARSEETTDVDADLEVDVDSFSVHTSQRTDEVDVTFSDRFMDAIDGGGGSGANIRTLVSSRGSAHSSGTIFFSVESLGMSSWNRNEQGASADGSERGRIDGDSFADVSVAAFASSRGSDTEHSCRTLCDVDRD